MPPRYTIRPLKDSDGAEAVSLTDTMDWGLSEADFHFMNHLEPKGCFVATSLGKVIGVITTIAYNHVGWIGNVIVQSDQRGIGIGKALVDQALHYLEKQGVTTIGLYAYQNVIDFYKQFGFVTDKDFLWLSNQNASWKYQKAPGLTNEQLIALVKLDQQCFGVARKKLLSEIFESFPNLCKIVTKNNETVAYLMASMGDSVEVGPWGCLPGFEADAIELFLSLADELRELNVFVGVPLWKDWLIDFLFGLGFKKDFTVTRMYRGSPNMGNECVLAMESLERG